MLSGDGGVEASGGEDRVLEPWSLDVGTLTPIGYEYLLPRPKRRQRP